MKNDTIEVRRDMLKVGDRIVSRADQNRSFLIEKIDTGVNGHGWPYLVLRGPAGEQFEHDTSFDSNSATYLICITSGNASS